MNYETQCREDARLAILAELADQIDATLNSRNLARVVEAVVPRRPAEWVGAQLMWLDQIGAVNIQNSNLPGLGPVIIATLTRTGRDHVERRAFIPGVSRPADEE
jgi:hypothetical protein